MGRPPITRRLTPAADFTDNASMRQRGPCLIAILLMIAGLSSLAVSSNQQAPVARQRVVIDINRFDQTAGYVELEDQDVISIRNTKGELQTLSKARILQIIRLVDPQPGQTGIVYLLDGDTREGVIIEDAFDHVLIEIEGIRAKLKRQDVSHVLLQPTFEERYAQAKSELQPGMFDAHLALCRWLFDQRRYELARDELRALLEQVEMHDARELLKLVEAQLALARPPEPAPGPAASRPDDDEPDEPASGPVYPADMLPREIISADDVNLMRVYEIDFDHAPKVTVTPDLVRELIEKYGTNKLIPASQTGRNAMFRAAADRPLEIVRLLFELKARDLYPSIKVNSEPYALNLFRQRVHDTWLINGCATSRCHGGPYAGPLFLHRRHYKDERVRYTNLLILERLKLDPQWPLVNWEKPEDSLIIQYALPRDLARKPHPQVAGWKPALNPTNLRLKDDAVAWMNSMYQPRPDYPVKYEPPRLPRLRTEQDSTADPGQPSR
jgi:hypothetical protein